MCLYYLVANEQGFEEPLRMGTEAELLSERAGLEKKAALSPPSGEGHRRGTTTFYLVPKHEWDSEHCPLIPVDLS
jgi:hypothetical protein